MGPRSNPTIPDDAVAVERFGPDDAPVGLVLDVPHGAVDDDRFRVWAEALDGPLPDDLIAFFRVNTDFGAPDLARAIARRYAVRPGAPPRSARVVLGRVPRTLIDLNREIDRGTDGGMTPGVPPWIVEPADRERLVTAWQAYQDVAAGAYRALHGGDGRAIAVHTYAPRSVGIDRIDDEIVRRLRDAYAEDVVSGWPLRPEADLIEPGPGSPATVDRELGDAIVARLGAIGIACGRSTTYRMVPETVSHRRAVEHPGVTACVEIRRDLLGAPWRPFERSRVDPATVARIAGAIADALAPASGVRPDGPS